MRAEQQLMKAHDVEPDWSKFSAVITHCMAAASAAAALAGQSMHQHQQVPAAAATAIH